MQLEPVSRQSVSDAVFEQLQGEILAGRLAAGEALPSERALTELLGVNRQAVREALKRLDQAGLVEINHGGVTRARDYRQSAGLDLLASLLQRPDGRVDVAVARSIVEMRACIGPDAARLCAMRAVSPVPDDLTAVVDAMADVPTDLAALAALDWRFWELIVDGSDNVAYRLAFNSLRDGVAPLAAALPAVQADELRDHAAHHAIAQAIRGGHEQAAERHARNLLQRGVVATTALLASIDHTSGPAKGKK